MVKYHEMLTANEGYLSITLKTQLKMTKFSLYLTVAISTIFYACEKKNMSEPPGEVRAFVKKAYIPKVIWNVPNQ